MQFIDNSQKKPTTLKKTIQIQVDESKTVLIFSEAGEYH